MPYGALCALSSLGLLETAYLTVVSAPANLRKCLQATDEPVGRLQLINCCGGQVTSAQGPCCCLLAAPGEADARASGVSAVWRLCKRPHQRLRQLPGAGATDSPR